jgi:hypothetical protein
MSHWRRWLPPQSLIRGRTVTPFAETIDSWLGHWFVDAPLEIAAEWSPGARPGKDKSDWAALHSIAPGLDLQERGGATGVLADALIPAIANGVSRSALDGRLRETIGRALLDDLLARLGARFGETAADGIHAQSYHLSLCDTMGRPVLRLAAGESLLTVLARQGLAPARADSPLVDPDEAIAGTEIEASARVGRARLSFAELRDLASGDVLILDSSHTAPLDLLVDGAIAAPAMVLTAPDSSSLPSPA